MVVICDLHLAIILEICGAVAFLHSLLMSAIVVSDKFADAILVFVCVAIRCVFFPALLCNVFLCAYLDVFYLCACWGVYLLTSGTFNLCLTNLCPDAPYYVRRFLSVPYPYMDI